MCGDPGNCHDFTMSLPSSARIAGRRVGILYIIGTLAGIASVAAIAPISSADNTLKAVADSSTGLSVAVLAVLTMGIALAMIPLIAYPVLRKQGSTLARGYIVFRSALESVAYMITAAGWLLLIPLSASAAARADGSALAPLADALVAAEGIGNVGTIVFVIGAAMFYTLLWRAHLVPRWLSGWGLVALAPYLVAVPLTIFGVLESQSSVVVGLNIPLALQEMVLAVWLIARGFREVPREA
jgi:hypothetical protein